MNRSIQLLLALLAAALTQAACAREAPPRTIKVTARTNLGNLPYRHYFKDQETLDSLLPRQPRMVDFLWRISFIELSEPEQDAYQPGSWAAALVDDGFEQTLDVGRGGYFRLPDLDYDRRNATIMFKEQSMPNLLKVAWKINVGPSRRLTNAEFGEAMADIRAAQDAIPLHYAPLKTERAARFDGLKACFTAAGGQLLIDGKPAADAVVGHCAVLKYDPARGLRQTIELRGPLQIVTAVDTAAYLRPRVQATAAHIDALPSPGSPATVKVSAHTNAGNLDYAWVYRDQQRMRSYLPAERAVDFAWRISFRDLSVAQRDAWTPQGWAAALVMDGWEQTVPVARGGYFLLPALPIGRQGATLMFKDQSQAGLIASDWIVRVGEGQRLAVADIGRAIDEVRAAQAAIPVQYEGLDQVRNAKYDGIKACFLEAGGAALIDARPAVDARLGNCAILKFDPDRAGAGQVIEFKGPLQVVTLVETGDYLQAAAATAADPDEE